MTARLRALLELLGIRSGELAKTAGMLAYLMMATGCFIIGRVARDSLFLSRFDISYLPTMYVWTAIAVAALSVTYSRFADRFRRDQLVLTVTSLLLAGVLLARLALATTGAWFYPVLYVFVEVMGGLLMIQFWTFAHDVFTTREAKRLFGIVGAGGVVASIVAGFSIGALAQRIGTVNLLWLCAGLLLGCLWMVVVLSRQCRRELAQATFGRQPGKEAISLSLDWAKVFSSRHLRLVAWITILAFATVTLVDYQFKIVARYAHLNREDQLSGYFGLFYGVCGVISFFIQFLLTGRLLQRLGLVFSLLLVPMAMIAGSSLFLVAPALWSATLLKGSDNVLRYTVYDAGTQVLYLPVPGRIRGRARAFVDGVLKPLSQGAAGLLIAWLAPVLDPHVQWFSFGALVLLLAWLGLLLGMKKEYIRSLINTLRQRKVHFGESTFSISDPQTVEALRQTLGDANERNVLHALEMIGYVRQHDWSDSLGKLLDHPSSRVRQEAIRQLAPSNTTAFRERILASFDDPDESVRAEAVAAFCSQRKEKAMDQVEPLLKDPSVQVQASAVVGLMRYGGLEGIVAAADTLRGMLVSSEPEVRKAGAWAVGRIGVKGFYRSLIPLFGDPESGVRIEVVRAAGELRSPELVLPLLQQLADRHTEREAVAALSAYGASLVTTLRTCLDNPREQPALRHAVPRVLGRIVEQLSMDVLCNILETEDLRLRERALEAILQLSQRSSSLRRDREMLRRLLHRELKEAYQQLVIMAELSGLDAPLLQDAIGHRYQAALARTFTVLRVLFPGRNVEAALRNLTNPIAALRANALELLDNLLDPETRRCLLPLLEDRDRAGLVAQGDALFPLLHRQPVGWLHELVVSPEEWTGACALDTVRRLGNPDFQPVVRVLLASHSALIRETAAFCFKRLSSPADFSAAVQKLTTDPHPWVRAIALRLVAERA